MNDGAAASSSTAPSVDSAGDNNDLFIKHKVSKMDTLAGLAIKYNISVADIKRANGFLTDTAMFGKETVLIPTQQLPLGQDVQMMVAQIFSGVGRDRLLDAEARTKPGSAAMALASSSQAAAHDTGQGDPGGDEFGWLASCGGICGDNFDQPPLSPSQRRSGGVAEPGDVELMDRSPKSMAAHYSTARAEELVRRRRREGEGNGEIYPDLLEPPQRNGYARGQPAAPAPYSAKGTFWGNMSTISKTINSSAFVQRIKKVASQPALATPTASSFAEAADAVLASFQRAGSAQRERPPRGTPPPAPAKKKDAGKAE